MYSQLSLRSGTFTCESLNIIIKQIIPTTWYMASGRLGGPMIMNLIIELQIRC